MQQSTSPGPVDGTWLISLEIKGDERGSLIALEPATGVPFDIARTYFIFGTQAGVARGFHAHRRNTQWAICVAGSCTFVLDDGTKEGRLVLDRPDVALHMDPMVWHEMRHFSSDCVLMVLAERPYEEDDYIRDRAAFRKEAGA